MLPTLFVVSLTSKYARATHVSYSYEIERKLDRMKGSGGISVEGGGLIIAVTMPAGFLGISKLILMTSLIMLDYCGKDYWGLFLCKISNQ